MSEIVANHLGEPLLVAGDYVDPDFLALAIGLMRDPKWDVMIMVEGRHIPSEDGGRNIEAARIVHHNNAIRLMGSLMMAAGAEGMGLGEVRQRFHVFTALEMDDPRTAGLTHVIPPEKHVDELIYDANRLRINSGGSAHVGTHPDLVEYVKQNHRHREIPILGGGPATSLVHVVRELQDDVTWGPLIYQAGFEPTDQTIFAKMSFNGDTDPGAIAQMVLHYPGRRVWMPSTQTRAPGMGLENIQVLRKRDFNSELTRMYERHVVGSGERSLLFHDLHLKFLLDQLSGADNGYTFEPLDVTRALTTLLAYYENAMDPAVSADIRGWRARPTALPENLVVTGQDVARHQALLDEHLKTRFSDTAYTNPQ